MEKRNDEKHPVASILKKKKQKKVVFIHCVFLWQTHLLFFSEQDHGGCSVMEWAPVRRENTEKNQSCKSAAHSHCVDYLWHAGGMTDGCCTLDVHPGESSVKGRALAQRGTRRNATVTQYLLKRLKFPKATYPKRAFIPICFALN